MKNASFRMTEPEVIRVRADVGEAEPNLEWIVTYSPAPPLDSPWNGRVVVARMEIASTNAHASVTVAAFLDESASERMSSELYADAVRDSDAIDSLWHFARIALAPSLSVVRSDLKIPLESPIPMTREFDEPL